MNLGTLKSGLLGGAAALALVVGSVPAYAQDDTQALRQQLEAMKERLAKIEANNAEKRSVGAAAAVEAGDKPRSWKLPGTNTSMQIGGFIKMSVYYNFTGAMAGSAAAFPGTGTHSEGGAIGLFTYNADGSVNGNRFNGGQFDFNARRSRFFIQTWTPTDWGELRTYIETDFANTAAASSIAGSPTGNRALRLRHAFASLGPVTMGQTTTTFGSLIGAAELLDDGAAIALGAIRVPLIRYSHNFGNGLVLHAALEDSGNLTDGALFSLACTTSAAGCSPTVAGFPVLGGPLPSGFIGGATQRVPDLVLGLQWNFPNGAVYASGTIGQINFNNGLGAGAGNAQGTGLARNDSALKWGVSLAGRYDFGRVEIGGQGYYGQGINFKYTGPTTGFNDVVLVADSTSNGLDLRPITGYAAGAYVQVKLTDTIRATGSYSWFFQEAASEIPGYYGAATATATGTSRSTLTGMSNYVWMAHGNLLWNPVPQVTFGLEYSYQFASRYNSANATLSRIQFAGIYRF